MNLLFCWFFFLFAGFCISTVNSAAALLPPVDKPKDMENLEGCYVPSINKMLSYEEPYSPQDGKSCVQYTCGRDGYTSILSCGAIAVSDNCFLLKGNRSLPYPDCCDKPSCKSTETISVTM